MLSVRAILVIGLVCLFWVCSEKGTSSAPEQLPAGSGEAGPTQAAPTGTAQYEVVIVKTYPHDPDAFTQGLVFFGGFLYESTGAYQRNSTLRRVDLETGKILTVHTLARVYFGEGLTVWQGQLIQLTWRSGVGFVYDLASFQKVGEFQYDTEGWGITHDGKSLIMSDGSAVLRFLDPESYAEKGRIRVHDQGFPVPYLNELEYIKGEIFANIWQKDIIARISPETGKVLGWINLSMLRNALGPVKDVEALNGIAYDAANDRIFVTGKLWPKLFQIKLVPRQGVGSKE